MSNPELSQIIFFTISKSTLLDALCISSTKSRWRLVDTLPRIYFSI